MPIAALAPVIILAVGFVAYCLADLLRSPVRPPARWWWALAIVVSVPLGGLAWLLAGRPKQ